MQLQKKHKSFAGETQFYSHSSASTKTEMKFSVFVPDTQIKPDSAIIWLSGLTCTQENFITKSGVQALLAETNTMIICPDTSPRGTDIEGEHDSYDFGSGAGFYVNATTEKYKENYNMYDYVNEEIYFILTDHFSVPNTQISIMGHSMGGHGALVLGLNNPIKYKSISAFSPIVNPMKCGWGQKAFTGYLGENTQEWKQYDACELIENNNLHSSPILIDQGTDDEFLEEQLLSNNFIEVCAKKDQALKLNMREGFDHSYYFIMTFLKDHIEFHRGD